MRDARDFPFSRWSRLRWKRRLAFGRGQSGLQEMQCRDDLARSKEKDGGCKGGYELLPRSGGTSAPKLGGAMIDAWIFTQDGSIARAEVMGDEDEDAFRETKAMLGARVAIIRDGEVIGYTEIVDILVKANYPGGYWCRQ